MVASESQRSHVKHADIFDDDEGVHGQVRGEDERLQGVTVWRLAVSGEDIDALDPALDLMATGLFRAKDDVLVDRPVFMDNADQNCIGWRIADNRVVGCGYYVCRYWCDLFHRYYPLFKVTEAATGFVYLDLADEFDASDFTNGDAVSNGSPNDIGIRGGQTRY